MWSCHAFVPRTGTAAHSTGVLEHVIHVRGETEDGFNVAPQLAMSSASAVTESL